MTLERLHLALEITAPTLAVLKNSFGDVDRFSHMNFSCLAIGFGDSTASQSFPILQRECIGHSAASAICTGRKVAAMYRLNGSGIFAIMALAILRWGRLGAVEAETWTSSQSSFRTSRRLVSPPPSSGRTVRISPFAACRVMRDVEP